VKYLANDLIVDVETFKVTSMSKDHEDLTQSKLELLDVGYLYWKPLYKVEDDVPLPVDDA
jgi:hypothetical protein